jgi:hypothetical protein
MTRSNATRLQSKKCRIVFENKEDYQELKDLGVIKKKKTKSVY